MVSRTRPNASVSNSALVIREITERAGCVPPATRHAPRGHDTPRLPGLGSGVSPHRPQRGTVPPCPRTPPSPRSYRPCPTCSPPPWPHRRSGAARPGRRWPRRCSTPSRPASTWPSRPGPAPASRWPTWSRPSGTPWPPSSTVVVATATIALQRQLIDRDLPRLVTALKPLLGREPAFAILKGRRNYLCLHRQRAARPTTRRTRCSSPSDSRSLLAARPAGQAAARVGRADHHRRPGRAGSRRARGGLAPGLGQRPGVHRRAALPVRLAVLRREGPGGRGQGAHRGHQPRAARHRRHLGHRRAARARRGDHRRGARPGGPGHLGHHGRAVRPRGGRRRPPRRRG